MWVRSLGREDPLEKGTATHASILAWEIPWTDTSTQTLPLAPALLKFQQLSSKMFFRIWSKPYFHP